MSPGTGSPPDGDRHIPRHRVSQHRLADLVWHLSGCNPRAAEAAVAADPRQPPRSFDEAIDIVAAALVRVRRRVPVSAA
jgi:hypothetical protein